MERPAKDAPLVESVRNRGRGGCFSATNHKECQTELHEMSTINQREDIIKWKPFNRRLWSPKRINLVKNLKQLLTFWLKGELRLKFLIEKLQQLTFFLVSSNVFMEVYIISSSQVYSKHFDPANSSSVFSSPAFMTNMFCLLFALHPFVHFLLR